MKHVQNFIEFNLFEGIKQGAKGDPYEYKEESGKYYTRKKGAPNWILAKGTSAKAIQDKIFTTSAAAAGNSAAAGKKSTEPAKLTKMEPYNLSRDNYDSQRYQRDTFDPFAQQNIKNINNSEIKAQQIAKGIVPVRKESFAKIAPQYRIFSEYLRLRKDPVTSKDFTTEELKTMKEMIEKTKPTSTPKNVDFYKLADFSFAKMKDGKEDYSGKDLRKNIAMSFGNASVSDKGSYYQLDDLYDFNNYHNHPENYTLAKVPETVSSAFKKIFAGNLVQGVESLASYYQKLGYKGMPVSIKIPKNLT